MESLTDVDPRRGRRAFKNAFWWCPRIAVTSWLIDVGWLAIDGPSDPFGSIAHGALAALWFSFTVAALVGVVVGALSASASAEEGQSLTLWRRVPTALFDGAPREHARRIATMLAFLLLLAAVGGVGFVLAREMIVTMARAEYAAICIVAALFGLALSALVLFAPMRGSLSWVVAQAQRVPGIRLLVARTFNAALTIAAVVLAVGTTFVVAYWEPLTFLPWRPVVQLGGALATAGAWVLARRHVRLLGRAPFVQRLLAVAAVVASAAAAVGLSSSSRAARSAIEDGSLLGAIGYAGVVRALDVDGDGDIPFFGGADCAPFDPHIHSGAMDLPDNGIDEDCDGSDLNAGEVPMRRVARWPINDRVPERPSVLLITIDALATRHLALAGGKENLTPNLDAIAKKSVAFSSCFSQGPSTRLSIPSLFTSRWDSQIRRQIKGRHPFPIDASELLLAEVLRDAGYTTTAIISEQYFTPANWPGLLAGFEHLNSNPMAQRGHRSEAVTDAALSELRSSVSPSFLWAHYFDAHGPHSQPARTRVFGKSEEARYKAELALVDREVGRLVRKVLSRPPNERPIVVISADHGIAFDEPRHAKRHYGHDLHTAVLHVPLIVYASFLAPRHIDGVTSTLDIAPTIANLLRIDRPLPFEGISLVPELLHGIMSRPQRVLSQFYIPDKLKLSEPPLTMVAWRTERYNFIHDISRNRFSLYDWRNDYWEKTDLIDVAAHKAEAKRLREELSLFLFHLKAPGESAKEGDAPGGMQRAARARNGDKSQAQPW